MSYRDESHWLKKFQANRTSAEFPFTGNAVRGSQQGHE